jgi:hypothetical protein
MATKAKKRSGEPGAELLIQPTGRISKRRLVTRARLLKAAYDVMANVGVDWAKIHKTHYGVPSIDRTFTLAK